MHIQNFSMHEIRTSNVVKKFYMALKAASPNIRIGPKWYENDSQEFMIKEKYKNVRCVKCNLICFVRQARNKDWYVQCYEAYKINNSKNGHTFFWAKL